MAKVGVATAVAAVSGYLVLFLAARVLGPADYAVFAVFWAAFGLVSGAVNGLMQETTRAVRAGLEQPATATGTEIRRARPIRTGAVIGVALAVAVLVTAPLWATTVFSTDRLLSVLLLAVGIAGFSAQATLSGALSGAGAWSQFSALTILDACLRLVVALACAVLGLRVGGFLVATVAGVVAWLIVTAASPRSRQALALTADVGVGVFRRRVLQSMAAATASAALVMGFPVILKATTSGALTSEAGAIILAVTLTRAPLLVPLNTFQGALISHLVTLRRTPLRALRMPVGVLAAVAVIGAALAAGIGPWLLRIAFGADYRVGPAVLAALTVGACMIGLLTVTGCAALAAEQHRAYALGWWAATIASVLLLLLPVGLDLRVSLSLVAGPVVGAVIHVAALVTNARAFSPPGPNG
ncbi:hypothetical protein G4X40_04135 [Rhodococcus sp. D2-41]|nr:hypothetical protein [Rhodococcus sp. D2-41]MDG3009333.1 hypothetical protein [Rhodococcus sp. D2-41]